MLPEPREHHALVIGSQDPLPRSSTVRKDLTVSDHGDKLAFLIPTPIVACRVDSAGRNTALRPRPLPRPLVPVVPEQVPIHVDVPCRKARIGGPVRSSHPLSSTSLCSTKRRSVSAMAFWRESGITKAFVPKGTRWQNWKLPRTHKGESACRALRRSGHTRQRMRERLRTAWGDISASTVVSKSSQRRATHC